SPFNRSLFSHSEMSKSGVFIVGAKRTAFGTFGGKLKNHSATDLGVVASKAALAEAGLKAEQVDHTIFGNVVASSKDGIYLTRHIGLKTGVPVEAGALTVNRLCGSGFQAVANAAQQIKLGESKIVIAGGAENMSMVPFAVRNVRFGTALGSKYEFEDMLWESLSDPFAKLAMGQTAEKLGAQYKVTRAEADAFALRSQSLWKEANEKGIYKREIAPMTVKGRKGEETFEVDEHPRPTTTVESLAKLKPVFQKDGLVNAGNASGISDGAAALVVAGEEAVKANNLKPLARVVAYAAVGCDPTIMGIGPAPAIRSVLKETGLKLEDIDIFEVNEAFAPQALAVQRDLGIPIEKLNVNGGAIALGHPLGASGARITTHLTHELQRTQKKYAIGSACIGGGQGIAVLLERC
ncbi:acaa-2, partial [Pristionchus pacificus]